ncbi:RecX family transcriptional regulator [Candidatus Saccharibacteria bacterium]|nr:RecX family transcriptional regulator [Candidatus Saccharibacteria bacterium]
MEISTINSKPHKITAIKSQIKNPNRANIFIDDAFSFSLNISQLADFKLKVGQQLGQEEFDNLRQASDSGKLYQRTLEWALTRPRSIKETRDYLFRKQAKNPEQIIDQLIAKKYLDDKKFARDWVENRRLARGISRRRLELELRKKGINDQIITQALSQSSRDDAQEIAKIITKKRAKYTNDPQKLIQYLIRQGFDYESAKTAVLEMDSQNSAKTL